MSTGPHRLMQDTLPRDTETATLRLGAIQTILVTLQIQPTAREGRRRGRATCKLVAEDLNGIGEVRRAVVVSVRCVLACRLRPGAEHLLQNPYGIRNVDTEIAIGVTTPKNRQCRSGHPHVKGGDDTVVFEGHGDDVHAL
jgi:hypothetical protein